MEQIIETDTYCLGCLCTTSEYKIKDYKIKYAHFKAFFVTDSIKLCPICRQKAHQAELFIENVQSNQILLENCVGDILSATIKDICSQLQTPYKLSQTSIQTDKLTAEGSDDTLDGTFTYFQNDPKQSTFVKDSNHRKSINKDIKVELKEELDDSDDELIIDETDDFQDSYVKEEDDFPLKELLKEEHIEGIEVMSLRTRNLRKKVVKKKSSKTKIASDNIVKAEKLPRPKKDEGIETIFITLEQCMEERKQQAVDKRYLNLMYKCENCLKGYSYKASYEMHMQRHAETSGSYECSICKLRMESEEKLASHQRYHSIRYRCVACGLQRVCRMSVKEHIAAQHRPGRPHVCPHCTKTFKRLVSFKKHVRYTHSGAGRVTCAYCHKTYANTTVLKSHMMDMHSTEVSSAGRSEARPYKCNECGAAFKCPSHLRNHGSKHTTARNYYCVECDKAFKSEAVLKQHLKTAQPHVNYSELPKHTTARNYYYVECDKAFKSEAVLKQHLKTAQPHVNYSELPIPCEHCERRFANRRDLERHTNRIHLHIKPYQCDKCERAYITKWALTDHRRRAHEGYRMPLRFPCKMCDKIFDRNTILKVHMRTHTGERPYQCDKCPAQFSQSSVLATHNKLIHLKLTRDGRPKASMK